MCAVIDRDLDAKFWSEIAKVPWIDATRIFIVNAPASNGATSIRGSRDVATGHYRIEGHDRYKTMTLATDEFIRRFLIHVLPKGLHRIRHYGLFANGERAKNIARARELLAVPVSPDQPANTQTADSGEPRTLSPPCPCCGGRMIIIETFERGSTPRYRPTTPASAIAIDTS